MSSTGGAATVPLSRRQHIVLRHANDLVTLSVGGREYVTFYGTLAGSHSHFFEQMFRIDARSGQVTITVNNVIEDKQGRVFINRDGDLFAYVMQFLRDGKQTVLPEDSNTLRRLTREAEFFNLPVFRSMLIERLQDEERLREQRDQHLEAIHNTVQQISQQLYVTAFNRGKN